MPAAIYIPTSRVGGFPLLLSAIVTLMMAIEAYVRRYLILVLICISLIIHSGELLFLCLLAICMCPLKKCLFSSFNHFFDWIFCYCWVVWAVFILWKLNPCCHIICKYFLPSVGCLFTFMVCFAVQMLVSLIRSHCLFIF